MPKKAIDDNILHEIKRHNKVLMEHMEHQVKTVAKQHSSVIRKLEEHDKQFNNIDQRFNVLEAAVMENSHGLNRVDQRLDKVDQRLDKVEQKLDTTLANHEGRLQKVEERVGT